MSNAKQDKPETGLTELMRDVDSYLAELSQENNHYNNTPTRAFSLRQPPKEGPSYTTNRSHTIHRTNPVDYSYQPPGTQSASATPVKPYGHYNHSDYVNTYLTRNPQENDPLSRSSSSSLSSQMTSVDTQFSRNPSISTTCMPSNYAFLSVLSKSFLRRIRALDSVRELFCGNEYPESFTGQEAIRMLMDLLEGIPETYCILIANKLMKAGLFEPVHYSQKSIIQGILFNSPDEYYTLKDEMTEDEVPRGIITSLLPCYSPTCVPGQGGCYVPLCPNKLGMFISEFHITDGTQQTTMNRSYSNSQLYNNNNNSNNNNNINNNNIQSNSQLAWAQRAPKELLASLSKREIARQEAINEMIYSEQVYKNDLETLIQVIVKPLKSRSNIISSVKKRDEFVKEVFGNCHELFDVSVSLSKDLVGLQSQNEFVPMIGDTLIQHVAYFEDQFSQYCPRVSLAEYLVKTEEKNNPDFERFLVHVEKAKQMRRLPFRHFLLNPVTRMQRYPLLLTAILKKTDKDHPDFPYLTKCLEMTKKVASQSDRLAEVFKKRVQILEINDRITFKPGESQNLQLTDPHRKLYYQGDIKRRSIGIEVTEKSDIHIFIFDHIILMTKLRKTTNTDVKTIESYRVWRKPIPLYMLHVVTNDVMTHTPSRTLLSGTTTGYLHGASNSFPFGLVPLTLNHVGRKGGIYLFSCLPEERLKWVSAIEEATSLMKKRLGEDVFDVVTLDDSSFRTVAVANGTGKQGKVNCTAPFYTINNEPKIAVGTDTGVYFKSLRQIGAQKVLSCENVTQLAVLEKYHILLVLSDKTLKAYPLDLVGMPCKNGKGPERTGQEIGQHIQFFQVGICNNRDIVIFKKKKNTMSIFTCLEPLYDLRDAKNQKYITQKTGFLLSSRSSHSWFKKYKEFYVGAEASHVHFLKSKMLIVCERGFEIIDPENLSVGGRDIPDKGDPQFNFIQRQADSIKPLAMYRVHDKFLLCYNKFCFFVNNRNGSLVQRGPQKLPLLCEWEGNPENIVFQYPYIIAFDPKFIEVHHVDTGDLVQIIVGDQVRLTHFSSENDKTVIQGCMTHTQRPEIQSIFYLKLNEHRNNTNVRKFM